MGSRQVIAEFKGLPPAERTQVARFVFEHDDSWIPDEFKRGMDDSVTGRGVELDTALDVMAEDPQIQRELRAINAEFAPAESDGLGNR